MDKDAPWQSLFEQVSAISTSLRGAGIALSGPLVPWMLGQIGAMCMMWVLASLLARMLAPFIDRRLRKIKKNPRLLRMLVIVARRLRFALFTGLLWCGVLILREVTWPSRSQLLLSVGSLATAWLVISIVSRIIRNRFVARMVATIAWLAAALNIIGLLPETLNLLDSLAIHFEHTRVSLLTVVQAAVALPVLIWLAGTVGLFAENQIRAAEDLTPSLKVLVTKLVRAILLIIAVLGGLMIIGVNLTAFAVFSGAVGLGIGFGLQKVVSNLISGIILLLDKSIKPGDVIGVDETYGRINSLAARYVSVIARDGKEYLIPNEDLITNKVVNWSFSSDLVRLDLFFGVSYESDPHEVRKLARGAAATIDRVCDTPAPVCHIKDFGSNSIDFVLRFWIEDPDMGTINVRGDVYLALWDALKEAGVNIPFPHREIVMRTPLEIIDGRKAVEKP